MIILSIFEYLVLNIYVPYLEAEIGEIRLGEPEGFHIPTKRIFTTNGASSGFNTVYFSTNTSFSFSFESRSCERGRGA